MRFVRGLLLALVAVLAGCERAEDFSDLKAWLDEVRVRPEGVAEPLPVFAPYQAFIYSATALRSPFLPSLDSDPTRDRNFSGEVAPDPGRARQFLEGFDIEQFEMVGTLSNSTSVFALLRGAGGVHRVKVGDYLGRNDGRIVSIGDSTVEVVEIVSDGRGAWRERPRTISLKERS
ncbi:pilus assembly protein PilP [Pseudomonas akapageensis]|uniref:pilus assembly protein PilP n=1 Tax=Pseudomonas akapageensis TaxID=2609961 RepID=UPI00140C6EAD|nr:pilus assembly protein PilP [Pseudomonas akapageensis]